MSMGIETYNSNGVLQFDNEGTQYVLTHKLRGDTYTGKYAASDSHLVATYSKRNTTEYVPAIEYIGKRAGGMYETSVLRVGYLPLTVEDFILVFEPISKVKTPATSGAGIELYDASGRVIYSSEYNTLDVRGVYTIPESDGATRGFYGPNTGNAYVIDTGIPATDPYNYICIFSIDRTGRGTDYDGDSEVDLYVEQYKFSINARGNLMLTLLADEYEVMAAWGGTYWMSGGYDVYGSIFAYVIDISRFRHLLV